MNSLEFLQAILPLSGKYVKLLIRPGAAPRQYFYDTIEQLHDTCIADSAAGGVNVYYAVASFKDNSSRKQGNVQALKALYIDIDCGPGKPYSDQRDGLRGLAEFVQAANMPKPYVVSSGNGIHVYWPFEEEIPVERWTPLAEAFKQAVINHNFQVDRAVPADSARVLRPPGTINLKGGGKVALLMRGVATDVSEFENMFQLVAPASAPATSSHGTINGMAIPAHVAARTTTLVNTLSPYEDRRAMPDMVVEKCAQIKWGVENQKDVPEPFWYGMLGVAAYCVEAEETAKAWSSKHPQYSEAATLAKMARWKSTTTGPTLCKKFIDERPAGCKDCRLKGKITTPAGIGAQYDEVQIDPEAPDRAAFEVRLPAPYKRTATGIVRKIETTEIVVCNFDIYPVGYGRDETLGYETVRFKWKRRHVGWTDLVLRQAYLNEANAKECSTALADQGIVLDSKGRMEGFQNMLRSYMDELRNLKSVTNLYASMGWKEDFSKFLIGDRLMEVDADGDVVEDDIALAGTGNNIGSEMYERKGTLEEAIQLTELLEKLALHTHKFSIGVGLSAPLYALTNIDGIVLNFYGDTGTGKTLAQLFQQAMWGNPNKLHFKANFTTNAMFGRLSYHNNLPMTIDETTIMKSKDIGEILFLVTQGQDKSRLNRYAEERRAKTWSTTVTTSANKSFAAQLPASGAENEAQLARLLDIQMPNHPAFGRSSAVGKRISEELSKNYGHIGPILLAHWMKEGPEALKKRLDAHYHLFYAKYGVKFAGHERFWEQAIIFADFALADAIALGLLRFTHEAAIRSVVSALPSMRNTVTDAKVNSFELLSQYLNEFARETVVVMHTGSNRGIIDPNREPRTSIRIRHDVYRKDNQSPFDSGTMMIEKDHLKKWLLQNGSTIKTLLADLEAQNARVVVPSDKAVLSRNTSLRLRQMTVIGVSLQHQEFSSILDIADQHAMGVAQAKLSVVK